MQNCKVCVPMSTTRKGRLCVRTARTEWAAELTQGRREPTQHSKSWECTGSCSAATSQDTVPGHDLRSDTFLPSPGRGSAMSSACSLLHSPTRPCHRELQLGNICSADSTAQLKMQALENLKKQAFAGQTCCANVNSAFWAETRHITLRKQIWGRYQTHKWWHLGWL